MPYYLDLNNKTHFLDSEEHEHFLPEGSRRMTSEEEVKVVEVRTPTTENIRTSVIRRKIIALEATLTQRRLRDAILSGDVSFVADIDARITVLREELMNPPALSEPAETVEDYSPMQPEEANEPSEESNEH